MSPFNREFIFRNFKQLLILFIMRNFIFLILLFPLVLTSCGNKWEPKDVDPRFDSVDYEQVQIQSTGNMDILTFYLYRIYKTKFGEDSYNRFDTFRKNLGFIDKIEEKVSDSDKIEYYQVHFCRSNDHYYNEVADFFRDRFKDGLYYSQAMNSINSRVYEGRKLPGAIVTSDGIFILK